MILNKPKYKIFVSTKDELDSIVRQVKQNYQHKYPDSMVEVNIEPEPDMIFFDGSKKEFNYKAKIKFIK